MNPLIHIKSLNKSFGDHQVLKDINLDVMPGECLAVVGPSGCGKSTLLNILGLLERPDSGVLEFKGARYPSLKGRGALMMRRCEINYIFQSFALIETQTVQENLLLSLKYTKLGKKEKLKFISEQLERFGLECKLSMKVNELSGGEKQRIALCRALLKPGDLILADEPTGSLDPTMGSLVMDCLIEESKRAGKTVIVVTHDTQMAQRCDRIVTLNA